MSAITDQARPARYPTPAPYVHPFPPKVTQSTQESAEGRSPKMTKRNGVYRCVLVWVRG